jgi:hypothetical protein
MFNKKEFMKSWNENHSDYKKEWRKEHPEKIKIAKKNYLNEHPWSITYTNIIQRCTNQNQRCYEAYKNKRGDITLEQLKELWFECKAYLMDKPSIDRIDPNGVYTKANLQYIEWNEHLIKTHHERKLKKLGVLK